MTWEAFTVTFIDWEAFTNPNGNSTQSKCGNVAPVTFCGTEFTIVFH